MEQIELVIRIPEEVYKLMAEKRMFGRVDVWKDAICNGIPLPKGHGRLKDENEIIAEMRSTFDMQDLYLPIHFKSLLVGVPTIVEADEEGAEG